MIIKKFQAETETEAIVLAREELGKEAIVMNIKKMKPKGIYRLFKKSMVEITAAIDDNVSYNNDDVLQKIREIGQKSVREEQSRQTKVPARPVRPFNEPPPEKEETTSAIEQRLNDLQVLLEQQMKNKAEQSADNDTEQKEKNQDAKQEPNISCIQLIYNQLIGNEMDEKYANQIVAEIEKSLGRDATVDNILSSIYQKLVLKLGQPETIEILENHTKYIFFIGPTGVGKTTTIAKIASAIKLAGKAKLALVTSDTYRIAAVEQLKTYSGILGIPLKVVYGEEELKEAQEEFSGFDLVMIDTAGRSHKNREQRDDIEAMLATVPPEDREVYLVLSATTKYQDLVKIAEAYKELTDYRLIFTKLDETDCIGNIFNIKMLTGVPLSYAAWGQNVPDDIGKMDAQSMAKQLLGGGVE